jgi:hypothetical protein
MPNTSPDLKHLARLGAGVRLQQLDQEQARIISAFPDLRGTGRRSRFVAPDDRIRVTSGPRKRRKMSAAGRAAIRAAARKRWAEWRKKKA